MADMELDIMAGMEADMFQTKCIGQKLFDAKCTRLACLLSFASLLWMIFIEYCFFSNHLSFGENCSAEVKVE